MTIVTRLAPAALATLGITVFCAAALAAGESEKEAQKFFVEGMKLMGKKQYAEACEKLAKSQALDPGMGTQYRLAECYEKLGRLASAHEQYTAVADAAKAANKPDREAVSRRRAAALEPRVAKLTIVVPPSVASLPGVELTRDGATVDKAQWGTPVSVDPGDHLVAVRAPGKKPWESKVWAEVSSKLTVSVALEDVKPPPVEKPPPPRSKLPAIVLGATSGLGLVLGVTFVGLRVARTKSAHTLHDKINAVGGNCLNGGSMPMFTADCSALKSATSSGDAFGTASIVSFVVSGAALAAGATYLLWPGPAKPTRATGQGPFIRWSPVVATELTGAAAWGAF